MDGNKDDGDDINDDNDGLMVLIIRAGGGMESVCQPEDVGLTSPLPPIGGQVSTIVL